jgi:hypothetical protein
VATSLHDNERLGRLLRLLRPAPEGWVARARQIFTSQDIAVVRASAETITGADVDALARLLENDDFRARFDADPIAAAEEVGLHELALRLDQDLRNLVALAERIAADTAYRAELKADPATALADAGMPQASVEPFLAALHHPDRALANAPDVVAHHQEPLSPEARALMLLLGSASVEQRLRAAAAHED